ncbi:MAG: hypothetical protein HYV09_30010 [Deltaproteobacteria bacterium]|nr:hypothetical protein [Deltaproteobacteria bacterium]
MSSHDVKSKILARRARFVAAAVASAGLLGCGSKMEACLSLAPDTGGDTISDTKPEACLTVDATIDTGVDTGPGVCLSPEWDSGAPDGATDAEPEASVCLSMPLDTGVFDTGPEPCLAPPPDGA